MTRVFYMLHFRCWPKFFGLAFMQKQVWKKHLFRYYEKLRLYGVFRFRLIKLEICRVILKDSHLGYKTSSVSLSFSR